MWRCVDDAAPSPLAVPPFAAVTTEGTLTGPCHDAGAPGHAHGCDHLAHLVRAGGDTCLVVMRGVRAALDGRPVPGGIARLYHGARLSLAARGAALQFWLSREGRRHVVPADAGAADALTLQPIAAGEPVVPCWCGAVYRVATWAAVRRCAVCGDREDGAFRLLPPDVLAAREGGAPCAS
ncbi:MAG: hypothetical protein AB7O97_20160 [Planctomycetota bacterium]